MKTDKLADTLRAVFGMPVSCVLKEEENQIIIRVFLVPEERKDSIEDAIYDLEESLYPNKDVFFSVITYTTEETKRYYPKMAETTPSSPDPQLARARNGERRLVPVGDGRDLSRAA
jgi:hypothetical protein